MPFPHLLIFKMHYLLLIYIHVSVVGIGQYTNRLHPFELVHPELDPSLSCIQPPSFDSLKYIGNTVETRNETACQAKLKYNHITGRNIKD